MISSTPAAAFTLVPAGGWPAVVLAVLLYALAAVPSRLASGAMRPATGTAVSSHAGNAFRRWPAWALIAAWLLHGVLLVIDIAGVGMGQPGARLGFAPVLSMTVWLVIAVYSVESRLVPLPAVRQWLAGAGLLVVLVCAAFPGEMRPMTSRLAPLHFALGVGAYALFGAAVLHAVMLDAAERRLRSGAARAVVPGQQAMGMPLLQLERVTFRFVEAGFVVLTATLVLGVATTVHWRWGDHKAVFSILAWLVFAALLVGRHRQGWRGRRATRWLYAGAALLLLAYVGSRFVLEVLLARAPT